MTIMNDETREFVAMHRNEDVRELALIRRHSGDFLVSHDVDKSWIIVDECG